MTELVATSFTSAALLPVMSDLRRNQAPPCAPARSRIMAPAMMTPYRLIPPSGEADEADEADDRVVASVRSPATGSPVPVVPFALGPEDAIAPPSLSWLVPSSLVSRPVGAVARPSPAAEVSDG
ncbi:hypothetical protein ACLQ2R_01890 [Streptosporangium sp. DT93]|uniref:hypothetical protein n=1 Tax=Streptosporangium sp. DT93 TaxID=3393428 RepID=UPI003CF28442